MRLVQATEADYPEIIALANRAYRGADGASASWNLEVGILEGQRMDDALLREELAEKPDGFLLTYRETAAAGLVGTAWLNPEGDGVWYLGLLMVRPDLQNRGTGRELLRAAEEFARERGARTIRMTVLHVRDTLVAWYLRRGYTVTPETRPFPYGDDRFGRPLRDDLHFLVLQKDFDAVPL